jgi:putative ABC transport system permease protein
LFSTIVVLTLTVGIGTNAGVFTVANGLAFRPLVHKDPSSFFRVVPVTRARGTTRPASYAEYSAFRDRSRSVRQLAAYAHFPAFIGEDNSAGAVAMAVSCNFFQVDGLDRAVLGRLLVLEDCYAGSRAAVALITQGLWRSRFASDPRIIGRVVDLNSRQVTIVGIVPEHTAAWTRNAVFPRPPSIFLPYTAQAYFEPSAPDLFESEEDFWLSLAGRLKPGFSRSNVEAELGVLARQQDLSHPGRNTTVVATDGSWLAELELTVTGRQLMLMAFFLGALHLVLFLSCANVATLLLARGAARRREIAVRLSLGSPRIRLVRMLVTESFLLAAAAGAASLYLAWRLPEPLFRLLAGRPAGFPMPVDWRTFTHVAGIVILTGIVAGLAPALESVKAGVSESLKGGSTPTAGVFGKASGRRLLGWLVSAQVAMSMLLLVGAALFAWAEDRTLRADPGFLARKVVVAPLYFSDNAKPQDAVVRLLALTLRVKALPGVHSVAFSEGLPLFSHVTVELRPPSRPDASQPVDVFSASPGFFDTLGMPLVRGRDFRLGETASVVVSESLARAFWRGQDPIGKALSYSGVTATVIGVVKDVAPMRFGGSENPAVYRPWRPDAMRNVLSVRFESGAATGAAAVRAIMHEIDPALPATARLAQSWIDQLTEDVWNVVSLILLLGLAAALLATTGIYGAVSFSVNQRTRELGIRMALGASRLDIIREVFVSGGKPVVRGLLVGLWLSVAAAAGLRQSFQGSPIRLDTANPLLYCGTALVLAMATVLAMLGPARRAARNDPLSTLRCD